MRLIKKILKSILPCRLVRAIQARRRNRRRSTRQVFEQIYATSLWGRSPDPDQKFYSGPGSHEDAVVQTYLTAMREFLSSFEEKPDVADLGCGDFAIGANLRALCGNYIACDIVKPLIRFNQQKFKALDVEFRHLDFTQDELPPAKIVFIRQVLQHLSNERIRAALPQIAAKYQYLVLTEHLPDGESYIRNLDQPTNSDTRLLNGSGVDLTWPPFKLKVVSEQELCRVPQFGAIIKTTLYQLAPGVPG
jgi:SAM-dependent methyltransferase